MTSQITKQQFFLFGTPTGSYALWTRVAGASMPAKVSDKVISRAKGIPVLIESVLKVINKTGKIILMNYEPPVRIKKAGYRPLNKREIKKAHKIFLTLCQN